MAPVPTRSIRLLPLLPLILTTMRVATLLSGACLRPELGLAVSLVSSCCLSLYTVAITTSCNHDQLRSNHLCLKAYAQLLSICQGMEVHGFVIKARLDWDVFRTILECRCIWTGLERVLIGESLPENTASWAALVVGCICRKDLNVAIDTNGKIQKVVNQMSWDF